MPLIGVQVCYFDHIPPHCQIHGKSHEFVADVVYGESDEIISLMMKNVDGDHECICCKH